MNLTEFLLARIAEDEIVAQMRQERGASGEPSAMSVTYGRTHFVADPSSPSRVLAECEAKRRIVESRPLPIGHSWDMVRAWHDTALRALALPYSDHPDYDEAWRA